MPSETPTPLETPKAVVPAPAPSDPHKSGGATTEFKLALWVSVAIGVLTGTQQILVQLSDTLPGNKWIASGGVFVAAILGVVLMVNKFVGGRSDVKVAQLEVEAAKELSRGPQTGR